MKDKQVYCNKCKEVTFRTPEESVYVCQGCGIRTPKKLTKPTTVSISDLTEKELETLVEPVAVELTEEQENQLDAIGSRLHKLSNMEQKILSLVVEGNTSTEIASLLDISIAEVGTYINRARTKLK